MKERRSQTKWTRRSSKGSLSQAAVFLNTICTDQKRAPWEDRKAIWTKPSPKKTNLNKNEHPRSTKVKTHAKPLWQKREKEINTQLKMKEKLETHTEEKKQFSSAAAAAAAKSLQSCPTLCDSRDGSPTGSPVPGILQARTLEWVAISFSNAWKWKVKVKSLSRDRLLATPWTAAHQAPPSMGFSRQEYWSGVPVPSPKFGN